MDVEELRPLWDLLIVNDNLRLREESSEAMSEAKTPRHSVGRSRHRLNSSNTEALLPHATE